MFSQPVHPKFSPDMTLTWTPATQRLKRQSKNPESSGEFFFKLTSSLPVTIQTFAGDVGHLWKTSESLLVYQELVRKGVRGLMWVPDVMVQWDAFWSTVQICVVTGAVLCTESWWRRTTVRSSIRRQRCSICVTTAHRYWRRWSSCETHTHTHT